MKRVNDREISSFFLKKTQKELGDTSTLNSPKDGASISIERLSANDIMNLARDPGKRKKINDFHPDDRDIVRREYAQNGPCQPKNHEFPTTIIGGKKRRFVLGWYEKHKSWIEYSVDKDAAFCFVCYLFKKENAPGGDAFVLGGFKAWNRFDNAVLKHFGDHMSSHNKALKSLIDFDNQKASIPSGFYKQSEESKSAYRMRLEASVESLKWLLLQGLPFRGHIEVEESLNRGNFLELLKLLSVHNPDYGKVVLKNAPRNCQMTAPCIQKEIINACAKETTKAIMNELDGDFFSILADESADVSDKEQMSLCLRYVNKKGEVLERFLGIVHVGNTVSLTLKAAIDLLLMQNSLSLSRVRGQAYDGASNMRGSINGLKTLILNEYPNAYYVHCFAHQLQLTLVAVAQKNSDCSWLFVDVLAPLLNFVGGSPKRKEFLREKQAERVVDALSVGELISGTGLNQELGLSRPGDTRWGSHFKTILHVIDLYPSILESLDAIGDISDMVDSNKAQSLTHLLMSFDFIFLAHLMIAIFGITNELSVALQKKDQDIVNAMKMVDVTKSRLQDYRDNGWESHMLKVTSFMGKNNIDIPIMEGNYVVPGRRKFRGRMTQVTNLHHFRVEVYLSVLDLQLQELENRFTEVSKELLICMSCFHPSNRFSAFDTDKLLRLAEFYPSEFSSIDLLFFEHSLANFISDVQNDERFWNLKNLNELSIKLVETKKHETHSKVYLLLKLVLLLPVATSTVERSFSGMTIVKDKLRNSMGDQLLNDCLVTFLEKDLFLKVSLNDIICRFQNMRTRREQL